MQPQSENSGSGPASVQDKSSASPVKLEMYGNRHCPYCTAARLLFKKRGLDFMDIPVASNDAARLEMQRRCGGRSVPQILINDRPIGGFDDLYELEQSGELDRLLATAAVGTQK